jgi:hypothetical protein
MTEGRLRKKRRKMREKWKEGRKGWVNYSNL